MTHEKVIPLVLLVAMVTGALAKSSLYGEKDAGCVGKGGLLCSNRGRCVGGRCSCEQASYGKLCELSMAGKCEAERDCVLCSTFRSGPLAKNGLCGQCWLVGDIEAIRVVAEIDPAMKLCLHTDEDGCIIRYGLAQSDFADSKLQVHVHRDKVCPVPY